MRIALVYDALYPWVAGGAERRFHELGRRLASRHQVTLVGWRWWEGPSTIEQDGMRLVGVGRPPSLYGQDGKRTVREAVAFAARLVPHLVRHRYDVIDCSATPYLPLYAAALGRRVRGGRLVATWHEFWGPHWHEYLPHRRGVAHVARALESHARRLGDRVVPVSPFTARAMGVAGDPRAEVVGNGVGIETIRDAEPIVDGADVLFMGRLIDEKRVDMLLEALVLLRDGHGLAPRTAVVGDGPELRPLVQRANELGLGGQVRFHGRVEGGLVPRHLRAARILVMPSVREGFGMAVAEAQAAGAVPVVVRSPFSAAPDLVSDGVDGLVTDPNAESVAAAIGSLLADPSRLAQMAAAAQTTAGQRSWDAVADRMEQVYAAVSARAVAPPRPVRRLRWL